MPLEFSEYLLLGAFIAGWLVAKVSGWIGRKLTTAERDPRDDRIRSLAAELRVAQTQTEKVRGQLDAKERELTETQKLLQARDEVIAGHESRIEKLRADLRESVLKTNELRAELTERATEQTRSEALLREVQTELSVARASSDLLASGMLDYNTADEDETPVFTAGSRP
ncbi:MAG TPA: hypothetical protein VKZ85_07210 [Woeseiaceae bacterium]|nr:hypothetical protein [Woeseiaceae bacterium]